MKINVERGAFLKGLNHVQSVVERRNTIPILSNVLIEAGKSGLKLTATDLDIEIVEALPADILRNGSATAPAHMLYDIVRKLPEGAQVQVELLASEGGRLSVSAGSSRFELACLPREDFPQMAAGALPHKFDIAASELKRLIDKTRFAISTEETRYYLNGIYLHAATRGKEATLRAVATDGHRLAQAELPLPAGAAGMPGIILPRKTVHELHRLIEDSQATISVGVSAAKARFEIGTITLTSKLIDGTFPDYARVIPKGNDKVLKVSNTDFISAVDRVSTIASERGRAVKLNLNRNKLVLSVNNPEGGSATGEIGVEYEAAPLEIGFNARYLLDIAGQLESDSAQFQLADPGSPTMVKDGSDEGALYVLMPLRV